jgi:hypothetical protein
MLCRPLQINRDKIFYVGIDIDKAMHHAYVVDANGMACVPKVLAFANTCAGHTPL